jgi:FkbM family methyltransferase
MNDEQYLSTHISEVVKQECLNLVDNETFIQIGVDCSGDVFLDLCKEHSPNQIILIDPHTKYNSQINEFYKAFNFNKIDAVVVSDPDINNINLYFPGNDFNRTGHCTIEPMLDWGKESLLPCPVDAVTINKIVTEYGITDIGLLAIDTEGNDYDILDSINFDMVNIKNIIFENWGFPTSTYSNNKKTYGLDGRAYILNKLKDNGFSIFESQCDYFCTKEK